MADNVTIDPGATPSIPIATDDVSGFHYQRIKLDLGGDGVSSPLVRGQQLAADSVPVVLASDQTVTLAAGSAAIGKLAANSGVDIGDVDVTSVLPGTGATSLGKAVDAAAGASDVGVAVLAVRDDALSALTPVDGDYSQLRVDANGALWVIPSGTVVVDGSGVTQPVSGTVTANLSATDNAVLDAIAASTAAGATAANQATIIGHVDGIEGLLSTIDADTGALAGCVGGTELQVDIVGALPAGTNAIGKLAANSGVDIGDVDVTSVLPGTGATSLGKAVDAATGASDVGVAALAKRTDTLATLTPANGDYARLQLNSRGALWVKEDGGTAGDVAHDGVDSGNPVKIGGRAVAHSSTPTAVAVGDRTDLLTNRIGIPFVMPGHPNMQTFRAQYTASQTNIAVITQATGGKIVVTRISVKADNANTNDTGVILGFGTAGTPTGAGVVSSHPGIPAGGGMVEGNGGGILGVGADDEDLRITCDDPGGAIDVNISYYVVTS